MNERTLHPLSRSTRWLCAGLMLLCSCDSQSAAPDAPLIAGAWRGQIAAPTLTLDVRADLRQEGDEVSGDGAMVLGVGESAFSIEVLGTYAYPEVALTFIGAEGSLYFFSGQMALGGGRITGTLRDDDGATFTLSLEPSDPVPDGG